MLQLTKCLCFKWAKKTIGLCDLLLKLYSRGYWPSPWDQLVKHSPANAGDSRDTGLISGWERFPGEGNGNPLQYSCLGNPMGREALRGAIVHGVAKSQTQLRNLNNNYTLQTTCIFHSTLYFWDLSMLIYDILFLSLSLLYSIYILPTHLSAFLLIQMYNPPFLKFIID